MSAEHNPAETNANHLVKVVFELPPSDWHDYATESMWAGPLGHDRYRLENVPFYSYNVSYGDVVVAKPLMGELVFQGVSQRGGHSTYRVFLSEGVTGEQFGDAWRALESLGCTYERASARLLAVDVPPEADIYRAYEILEHGEAEGVWDFEEANCAHPLNESR